MSPGNKVLAGMLLLSHFSCVQLCATPWAITCWALLSMKILQARILEWIAMPSSRETQGLNPGLPHCRQIYYCLCHQGSPLAWTNWVNFKDSPSSWISNFITLHCKPWTDLFPFFQQERMYFHTSVFHPWNLKSMYWFN